MRVDAVPNVVRDTPERAKLLEQFVPRRDPGHLIVIRGRALG
jgi:hypothetical protein